MKRLVIYGMKNLVQDSAIKSHHDKEFNVLKNDKNAIDEATTLLHDIKNNSFIYERYKTIANKYFPKQTSGYFLNNEQY